MNANGVEVLRVAGIAGLLIVLVACGSDGGPSGGARIPALPGDAVPRPEARSRYGNGPQYEVFGKTYRVMDSASGYKERGVASWYGKKFHGRLTSNRETYDMYAMTAAHKTLPLPTYVEVRNLRNNKKVVVRVNDRGPFVHNRLIDLSYSAAMKLDMIKDGTSLVEVRAITFDEPAGDRPGRTAIPIEMPPETAPETAIEAPVHTAVPPVDAKPEARGDTGHQAHKVYVQVGAFGSRNNAERRHTLLLNRGIGNAFIHRDATADPALYRVRIGPIVNGEQYDLIVEELAQLGISKPYLVTE